MVEKHKNVLADNFSEMSVIDYYIMYDFENSKSRPTEIVNHVDTCAPSNGYFDCEYEILFANDGCSRRVVIDYRSSNIPMYQLMESLTQEMEDIFEEGEIAEDDLLYGILEGYEEEYEEGFELTLFDDLGEAHNVGLEDYEDLLSMIVSIRLLKCEFVKK